MLQLSAEQMSEREQRRTEIEQTFDYDGYQVARRELFAHLRDPAIIIREIASRLTQHALQDWRMWCISTLCLTAN